MLSPVISHNKMESSVNLRKCLSASHAVRLSLRCCGNGSMLSHSRIATFTLGRNIKVRCGRMPVKMSLCSERRYVNMLNKINFILIH